MVTRVRLGEPRAVRAFVERLDCARAFLENRAARSALRATEDDLNDMLQNTILALWRKLDAYSGRSRLETWIYGFCVFEMLKWSDRQQRAATRELPDGLESEGASRRTTLDLQRALAGLPALERETVALKHFEGLTFREVAERQQAEISTVKTRYYRTLQRLRRRLTGT